MPKPSPTLGAGWMSESEIRSARESVTRNDKRRSKIYADGENEITKHAETVRGSLQNIGGLNNARSITNKAIASRRRELAASTSDARTALIRELKDTAERVKAASVHYKSAMQMLMRESLGSERRSRLMQQIEQSGPVELTSLAEFAAVKRDGELAAALCGRVSAMKPSERPFSPNELADVICGELHRELSQTLVECERRVLEALQDDAKFETGRSDPKRSLDIAMLKRREAEIGAYVADDEQPEAA